jgi:hypothetical protein
VFVTDFLGARGIKSSGLDTLNRAIDQDMDAQIAEINKEGQVVGMFGDLYRSALSQSATQAETRERMRGMYLESFKAGVVAQLSKYDAPLAQVAAQKALADIDAAQQDVFLKLRSYWQERADVAKNRQLQKWQTGVQAATTRYGIDKSYDVEMAKINAAKAPSGNPYEEDVILNPLPDADGKTRPVRMFLKNTSPADRTKVRERSAMVRTFASKVAKFKAYIKAHPNMLDMGPESLRNFINSDPKLQAMQIDLAMEYVTAKQGSRPSDMDLKQAMKTLPLDSLTTDRGEVAKTLDDRINDVNNGFKDMVSVMSRDFYPEELADVSRITGEGFGPAEDYAAETRTEKPKATDIDTGFQAATSQKGGMQDTIDIDSNSPLDVETAKLWDKADLIHRNRTGNIPRDSYPRAWARKMVETADEARRQIAKAMDEGDKETAKAVYENVIDNLTAYQDPGSAAYYPGGEGSVAGQIAPESNEDFQRKSKFAKVLLETFTADQQY